MRMKVKTKREGRGIAAIVLPSLRAASHYAADKAIADVKTMSRATIRSVGLGGLANAVDATSSLKKRDTAPPKTGWGAVYARGGQYSRANQALMSYTEGAVITPGAGKKWLAYPTKSAGRLARLPIPRTGGRAGYAQFKNQPSRVRGMQLEFVPFNSRRAALVLRRGEVSKSTGRARNRGARRSRHYARKDFIVMFWLIRITVRAKRFDQHRITQVGANSIPRYVFEFQQRDGMKR